MAKVSRVDRVARVARVPRVERVARVARVRVFNSVGMFGRATGRGRQVANFARENFAFSRSRAAFSRWDARERAGSSPLARNRGS